MADPPSPRSGKALAFALVPLVVLLDQLTKGWARMQLANPLDLGPVLNLGLSFNRGVSFGLFSADGEAGRWFLVAATGAVAAAMLIGITRVRRTGMAIALALIAGGALGNIADRVRQGAVTDFIDVHLGGAHWPTFNLADAAIVLGVATWLVLSARKSSEGDGALADATR
jgi:signal peptidase II